MSRIEFRRVRYALSCPHCGPQGLTRSPEGAKRAVQAHSASHKHILAVRERWFI